jgi:hypothetical protein
LQVHELHTLLDQCSLTACTWQSVPTWGTGGNTSCSILRFWALATCLHIQASHQ